jgi:RNA polymerase sigma factor (sigma-70 family)
MAGAELEGIKDAELVRLARSGDMDAFGRLIERFQGQMKSFAIRLVDNEDIALEMVQDAYLQAFLSLQNLNDPDHFKSWLFGIVVNLCRSHLRKEQGKDGRVEELSENTVYKSPWSHMVDPESLVEKQEDQNQLLSLIAGLKPIYRQVILLFYFRHLKLGEIAEREGISLDTVKVRLHRARGMLRAQLRLLYPEMDQAILPADRRKTMLLVKVVDVIKLSQEEGCIVLLMNEPGDRLLPIWIGAFEGLSIAAGIENMDTPRPLTYRWITSILEALEVELDEIRIEGLKEDTFLGTMVIQKNGRVLELDARPSDLIALAVHKGAPIYAGEELMIKNGIELSKINGTLQPFKGVHEILAELTEVNRRLQEARSSEVEKQDKRDRLIEKVFGRQ